MVAQSMSVRCFKISFQVGDSGPSAHQGPPLTPAAQGSGESSWQLAQQGLLVAEPTSHNPGAVCLSGSLVCILVSKRMRGTPFLNAPSFSSVWLSIEQLHGQVCCVCMTLRAVPLTPLLGPFS
jgi:hypothetical protein